MSLRRRLQLPNFVCRTAENDRVPSRGLNNLIQIFQIWTQPFKMCSLLAFKIILKCGVYKISGLSAFHEWVCIVFFLFKWRALVSFTLFTVILTFSCKFLQTIGCSIIFVYLWYFTCCQISYKFFMNRRFPYFWKNVNLSILILLPIVCLWTLNPLLSCYNQDNLFLYSGSWLSFSSGSKLVEEN